MLYLSVVTPCQGTDFVPAIIYCNSIVCICDASDWIIYTGWTLSFPVGWGLLRIIRLKILWPRLPLKSSHTWPVCAGAPWLMLMQTTWKTVLSLIEIYTQVSHMRRRGPDGWGLSDFKSSTPLPQTWPPFYSAQGPERSLMVLGTHRIWMMANWKIISSFLLLLCSWISWCLCSLPEGINMWNH